MFSNISLREMYRSCFSFIDTRDVQIAVLSFTLHGEKETNFLKLT